MAKRKQSIGKPKGIPPTKAASGAGFTVEDKVAALCATALLLGRSPLRQIGARQSNDQFSSTFQSWPVRLPRPWSCRHVATMAPLPMGLPRRASFPAFRSIERLTTDFLPSSN